MNILLVTNYYEPDQGAAAIIVTRLAKKLAARGHRLTVLTSMPNYPHGRIVDGYRGKPVVVEERDGVRVIQTWLWATPSPRVSRKLVSQMSFMLTATLRGLGIPRPDVMLVEAAPMFTGFAGFVLSTFKRVPYVLDVHDLWPDHMLTVGKMTATHPAYRVARSAMDALYRGASGIIALTPYLEKVIQGYLPTDERQKTTTLFSGVDLQRFRPGIDASAFRQEHGLGDARLVAYIGTLGTAYDPITMLEAARQFAGRQDVRFVIMGTGTQRALVEAWLQQGDLPNVRWIEWVDYAAIPQAWAATHIAYWALYDHELHKGAIGTKMYEAMSSGVPVCVALEGVVADVLRESGGGLSSPFEDAEALAANLRRLLDDDTFYHQCSQNARRYAEAHFDAEQTALAYEDMLLRAVR
ncbi:MAG TPA: glycosyltransferase family 4 protein [Aggregatilineales bacterium]|nr:glycosyltransferase family 4 protein [Aggregatilineales bacterium]